jgi:hypothetical protein
MPIIVRNAGARAAWDSPSKGVRPFDGSHPLQLFTKHIPAMRTAMDKCRASAFAFSPLNALPKIALDKWTVTELKEALMLVDGEGKARVVPLGSQQTYYDATLQVATQHPVKLVPAWLAEHVRKAGYKVKKQHDEYIIKTADTITMPGGSLKSLRKRVKHARAATVVEEYSLGKTHEYKALNALWYKQNAGRKFRTYDKTSIDWLIMNWASVVQADPTARFIGIRDAQYLQLIAINMGCVLSDGVWTAYTRRFDREAEIQGAGALGHVILAESFSEAMENNGTADTKEIKENKARIAAGTLSFYEIGK